MGDGERRSFGRKLKLPFPGLDGVFGSEPDFDRDLLNENFCGEIESLPNDVGLNGDCGEVTLRLLSRENNFRGREAFEPGDRKP